MLVPRRYLLDEYDGYKEEEEEEYDEDVAMIACMIGVLNSQWSYLATRTLKYDGDDDDYDDDDGDGNDDDNETDGSTDDDDDEDVSVALITIKGAVGSILLLG